MKALKLLTKVKTYVPSIYRALAKYACNLYRKCTSQVLKQNSLFYGNFILIKTCLSSAFYATGFDRASGFHRLGPMKSRGPVNENSSGRRKWLEEKVKKGTEKLLESYQRGTDMSTSVDSLQAILTTLSAVCASLQSEHGQASTCKHSQFLSWVKVWFCSNKRANRLKLFLNRMLSSIHDSVSECVGYVLRKLTGISLGLYQVFQQLCISFKALKSIRTYSLLVLMFYMFSLSAQTPRKDSGAEGLITVKPLLIGQKMPDEFWNKEFLFFRDGDTVRQSLEKYKGKMMVLDFWSSGCTPCLLHQKEIKYFTDTYKDDLVVIMVNSKLTREKYGKIRSLYDKGYFEQFGINHLESIIEDDYLVDLFAAAAFPNYIWINNIGRLQLKTYKNLLDRNYVAPFIDKL